MKAVLIEQYDSIDNIRIREVNIPTVSAGQLRVKVLAASIGFVDSLKVQGLYQTRDPLPFTPGMEFAGLVEEVGEGVQGFSTGMPVMGVTRSGALAEYLVIPASEVQIMPNGIAPEIGASFHANYLTALYALGERAALRAGQCLLVLGAAGGVGTAAVQIGKILKARVIAAASTEEKRAFATRCGADATIDYTQPNWRDVLKELTMGHGADVIFDPVGGEISVQAFRSIAWNGRHVVVGFASGEIPALPFNLPLLKGGILLGVDSAQLAPREPEVQEKIMGKLLTWLEERALRPVVGRVFEFENFREAFKTMRSRLALGKMVVRISQS